MIDAMRKYEFSHHEKLLKRVVDVIRDIVRADNHMREIIKEAAMELLMVICVHPEYKVKFADLPFEVFDGFK